MKTSRCLLLACLLLSVACTTKAQPPTPAEDPAAAFSALEERLLEGPLHLQFEITSQGVFQSRLTGALKIDKAGTIQLVARGRFGGTPVLLGFSAGEDTMRGGVNGKNFQLPRPDHMREAIVLGLTRMGLLHNLSRLFAVKPPDHAKGGVDEWVQLLNIQHRLPLAADQPPHDIYLFDIAVDNQPAGSAQLHVDSATGLPYLRRQVIRFKEGEMRVTEEYRYLP